MTFTDEPSIIVPGAFGLRIENIVVCDDDGGAGAERVPERARLQRLNGLTDELAALHDEHREGRVHGVLAPGHPEVDAEDAAADRGHRGRLGGAGARGRDLRGVAGEAHLVDADVHPPRLRGARRRS